MLFFRQLRTLVFKDFYLIWNRKAIKGTIFRAFYAPIIFSIIMGIVLQTLWPSVKYGFGRPEPVMSLVDAMDKAGNIRPRIVFVNSVNEGGQIDDVIDRIAGPLRQANKNVTVLRNPDQLLEICRSTLRAVTECYGAVVFNSSPTEGPGKVWNYTLRSDGSFGMTIDVNVANNEQQIFMLPFQKAIDEAIIATTSSNSSLPKDGRQYPYTSMNQEEYRNSIKHNLQNGIRNFLAIVFYLALIGLCYHMVGVMAKEREIGMSQLLESMMPNTRRWEPQVLRLWSHHIAFSLTYLPSWIVVGVILKAGLFTYTNLGFMLVTIILAGLALASWSLVGGAFFRKAQLSGITVVIVSLALGVIAQVMSKNMSTATVGVLALLFTPMTFVFNLIFYAQWEHSKTKTELATSIGDWKITGVVFWIFFAIQILAYPVLAAIVERLMWGSAAVRKGRKVNWNGDISAQSSTDETVRLDGFGKTYKAGLFGTRHVHAVDNLSFSALRGQMVVLLGVNGCGKSTTLNTIAGLDAPTEGAVTVDGTGGIGICPQKNVLWDHVSVREHAEIFTDLKSTKPLSKAERKEAIDNLINVCDLGKKTKAMSMTLSGGQKRKLQLICMLTGGSQVCCVDEVSGGLDPLSRQYIWNILMAEKGKRTIILTTHFLDEAEVLADKVVIMARGKLMDQGSVSELKSRIGGGYRVTYLPGDEHGFDVDGKDFEKAGGHRIGRARREYEKGYDREERASNITEVVDIIKRRDNHDGSIQVSGPTIEEVFVRLAGSKSNSTKEKGDPASSSDDLYGGEDEDVPLQDGRSVSTLSMIGILFRKRMQVFRHNWKPYALALIFPIVAAICMSFLINDFDNPGCDLREQVSVADVVELSHSLNPHIVLGPQSVADQQSIELVRKIVPQQVLEKGKAPSNSSGLPDVIQIVGSINEFNGVLHRDVSAIIPGGLFLDQSNPVFVWRGDIGPMSVYSPIFMQNLFNVLASKVPIVTNFAPFDVPWPPHTGRALQFVFYFGLVMSAFPAFFALYPNFERMMKVRELQYSNGVRPLPLWTAYVIFDWIIALVAAAVVVIVLAATAGPAFWQIGYFALVMFLYGLTSILVGYNIANICRTQLSSFAFAAGGTAVLLLLYLVAYMSITAQAAADTIDRNLILMHFTFGLISPIAQLLRALIVGLNLFSVICHGAPPKKISYGGDILAYGGPILYLILQAAVLFGLLIWADSHFSMGPLAKFWPFKSRKSPVDRTSVAESGIVGSEVAAEVARTEQDESDGLRVLHVSKTFAVRKFGEVLKALFTRKTVPRVNAVEDVSFGVRPGEVFGLLGPNGAGKTTTISMIRGDLAPNPDPATDILVCGKSIRRSLLEARSQLGVCPQFDATDQLTVDHQLAFYARIRGVPDVKAAVDAVVRGVGLTPFRSRLASALSGGNRRKLSLAISLLGNPNVLLLDEPSSGMDPLAKRNMWRILSRVTAGRSILLTTHSMEEADALADRMGVLARRMLEIGSASQLRRKYGHGFNVHLVAASEPHTTDDEVAEIARWFETAFPGTDSDQRHYHGQMRFNVPYGAVEDADIDINDIDGSLTSPVSSSQTLIGRNGNGAGSAVVPGPEGNRAQSRGSQNLSGALTIAKLFVAIERNKEKLGIRYYSVSPTTLDEIFVRVVKEHGVEEDVTVR